MRLDFFKKFVTFKAGATDKTIAPRDIRYNSDNGKYFIVADFSKADDEYTPYINQLTPSTAIMVFINFKEYANANGNLPSTTNIPEMELKRSEYWSVIGKYPFPMVKVANEQKVKYGEEWPQSMFL